MSTRVDPWEYDREMYKRRNEIERLFRRLKGFRRIFSRFEKLDTLFLGFILFALIFDALEQALAAQTIQEVQQNAEACVLNVPANMGRISRTNTQVTLVSLMERGRGSWNPTLDRRVER